MGVAPCLLHPGMSQVDPKHWKAKLFSRRPADCAGREVFPLLPAQLSAKARLAPAPAADYGLGNCANSLELGCDCLGNIQYFDALLNNSKGGRWAGRS